LETLQIYLLPIENQQCQIILTKSPTGDGEITSLLPFWEDEQDRSQTIFKCLGYRELKLDVFSHDEQEWMVKLGILDQTRGFDSKYLAKIGQVLYQAIFPQGSQVTNRLLESLRLSESKNTQLHIQLKFTADVVKKCALADYPWELLHDGDRFLLHHNLTISRYIAYDSIPPNLVPSENLNILHVSSNTWDTEMGLGKLGEEEAQAIDQGLRKASEAGNINLRKLANVTRDQLREYLTECGSEAAPHVIHFDGHGIFGKRCSDLGCRTIHGSIRDRVCRKCGASLPEPQGYLVFEDERQQADYVSAMEFGQLLSKYSSGVALVVLSACKSGMALEVDSVFNGTAQNLIGQRIPAVVAMQYAVDVVSATQFAKQFYRSLGQKHSLGKAIAQAREAMGFEGNQWYRPVLYLRWEDHQGGQLFNHDIITSQVTQTKQSDNETIRLQHFRKRLAILLEELEALENQLFTTISAVDKLKLERAIKLKIQDIEDVQKQIQEL